MDVVEYAKALVAFDSTSDRSNVPVSEFVEETLVRLRFELERLEYVDERGERKLSLVAKRGTGRGGLALSAHTDVVPAEEWTAPTDGPFQPSVVNGRLYGRGSCDMKGSLAAMLAAAEATMAAASAAPLYLIVTADEEVGFGGARQVAEDSELFREMVAGQTRAVVGEPTRLEVIHAHKGSYGLKAVARGRAAHSSTREGINANLAMIPFLNEMKAIYELTESDPNWLDSRFDPPTISWNIGINDHTRAINMTAAQSICTVHFRPAPGMDVEPLLARARQAAHRCGLELELFLSGPAYHADPDSPFVQEMLAITGTTRPSTVSYGTDASMFTALEQMVICGPGDIAQAHTADEWIALDQLQRGTELFTHLIERWCL